MHGEAPTKSANAKHVASGGSQIDHELSPESLPSYLRTRCHWCDGKIDGCSHCGDRGWFISRSNPPSVLL